MGQRFSVIIPTYNRAGALPAAIDSVLGQSLAAHEIIVIDDGSTDGTGDVLAAYGARIVAIRQPNGGVSAARNTGLARATGDIITFLDSDDIWLPQRLEIAARALSQTDAVVHVADVRFESADYEESLFEIRKFAFPADHAALVVRPLEFVLSGLSLMSIAVRRDALAATGGFDQQLAMFEDLDLLVRLGGQGAWLFQGQTVCRARRIAEDSALSLTSQALASKRKTAAGRVALFSRLAASDGLSPRERTLVANRLSWSHLEDAEARLASGDRRGGLASLGRSVTAHANPLKALAKAATLMTLGGGLYRSLAMRNKGFYREADGSRNGA
ncbi:MAG: glycosyltransferase family 2 protein [Hyphomicrobiaceae bacterium]